ncbi:hypothetical protein [Nostoc sp. 'Lobaria pulmonaria (5183) cyanobiont']|nr:hypothetical protein [Nostoc sp. 'Lobaria pulmonaria (5183) cyanobiont']
MKSERGRWWLRLLLTLEKDIAVVADVSDRSQLEIARDIIYYTGLA